MARRHHESKSSASRIHPPAITKPISQTRDEVIETESIRLMKAHALLGCITRAMEGDGICSGEGPYWPAAIEAVSELINESIRQLENLAGLEDSRPDAVRDIGASYDMTPIPGLH
ncbi:hypothetical protein [Povalibacter sp.]|uniref:hypothetical protein n=1 Tax=Povalibacter sp. TaxID=1962978 RepID=UPI002F408CB4